MAVQSNSSSWILKRRFLHAAFLAWVGTSICFPESDLLFPFSAPHSDVLDARNDATEFLIGQPAVTSPWFRQKIGLEKTHFEEYISPVRFNPDLISEVMSKYQIERDQELGEKVNDPLYRCLFHSASLPLRGEAMKEFDSSILAITEDVDKFREAIREHNYPELSDEMSKIQNEIQLLVTVIQGKIQQAQKILRSRNNLSGKASITDRSLLSMAFRLNDIFLEFLATSEKYKLISVPYLVETFNEKGGDLILFNYILRYGSWKQDVIVLYLNHDFERSMKESPFTQEIHGILQCLNQVTWKELERHHIYLAVLGSKGERPPEQLQVDQLIKLGRSFFKVTSPELSDPGKREGICNDMIVVFLKDLFEHMFGKRFDSYHSIIQTNFLSDVKLTHNMLYFLVNHKFVTSQIMFRITTAESHSRLQTLDAAIFTFTNVLKAIYAEYGELIRHIALDDGLVKHCLKTQRDSYLKIYLTDLKQVNGGKFSNPQLHEGVDSIEKGKKLIGWEQSSRERSLFMTANPDQKYLDPTDNIFQTPREDDFKVRTAILERSLQFLKAFNSDSRWASTEINPFITRKNFLENLLNEVEHVLKRWR